MEAIEHIAKYKKDHPSVSGMKELINTKTGKIFYCDATDITEFDSYYIISW